jgi:hypothetical protein
LLPFSSVEHPRSSEIISISIKIKTVLILPAVLYGSKEEQRLKAFRKGMLRRIFGLRGGKNAGF